MHSVNIEKPEAKGIDWSLLSLTEVLPSNVFLLLFKGTFIRTRSRLSWCDCRCEEPFDKTIHVLHRWVKPGPQQVLCWGVGVLFGFFGEVASAGTALGVMSRQHRGALPPVLLSPCPQGDGYPVETSWEAPRDDRWALFPLRRTPSTSAEPLKPQPLQG